MSAESLPEYKKNLISTCTQNDILLLGGSWVLKSGRTSPYFFQAGSFSTAALLSTLGDSYAQTIASHPTVSTSFDVIFGPAYKGIPLASVTAAKLHDLSPEKYGGIGYAFNRKEKKDHGEGGSIVGASLKGKRVLIIDDVITAGTAIREAVQIIQEAGGELKGIIVALDRQERLSETDGSSAIQSVQKQFSVDVIAILTLEDLIAGVDGKNKEDMIAYRDRYGAVKEP